MLSVVIVVVVGTRETLLCFGQQFLKSVSGARRARAHNRKSELRFLCGPDCLLEEKTTQIMSITTIYGFEIRTFMLIQFTVLTVETFPPTIDLLW